MRDIWSNALINDNKRIWMIYPRSTLSHDPLKLESNRAPENHDYYKGRMALWIFSRSILRDVIVVLLFSFFFTGLFLLSYTRRYNEAKKRTFRSLLKIDRLIELDNFRDKIFLRDISSSKVIQYNTICNIFWFLSFEFCDRIVQKEGFTKLCPAKCFERGIP